MLAMELAYDCAGDSGIAEYLSTLTREQREILLDEAMDLTAEEIAQHIAAQVLAEKCSKN